MSRTEVVVTLRGREFGRALHELRRYGRVRRTRFFNVLVVEVEDPEAFLEQLRERHERDPALGRWLARVEPLEERFAFGDAAQFEQHCKEALAPHLRQLEGKSFHVRVHRRGLREKLSGHGEEVVIDTWLLDSLAAAGHPGRIDFEDPDAVIDVETLGTRAGASIWSREQLQRFPFLHPD